MAPSPDQRFSVVTDAYGNRLALVFGNHAADGRCPFLAASRCYHCDIGLGEGISFDIEMNRQRLDWYRATFRHELATLVHLVIYNSGSVLNPAEMPWEFLQDILVFASKLKSMRVVSLDSRESYVTVDRLLRIAESLKDDQCARIIIGIESASDFIRNQLLRKEMTLAGIQRAFDRIAQAAEHVGLHRFGIDVNILVGGPGTTLETAVSDALDTARFALTRSQVPVDFNIHPYYPSSRGLKWFPTSPRCSTSVLIDAVQAISSACSNEGRYSRIFVGLNDEGHDTDLDGRESDLQRVGAAIREFNATQKRPLWSEARANVAPT